MKTIIGNGVEDDIMNELVLNMLETDSYDTSPYPNDYEWQKLITGIYLPTKKEDSLWISLSKSHALTEIGLKLINHDSPGYSKTHTGLFKRKHVTFMFEVSPDRENGFKDGNKFYSEREMVDWCVENCKGSWGTKSPDNVKQHHNDFHFNSKDDAVLFKLTWG